MWSKYLRNLFCLMKKQKASFDKFQICCMQICYGSAEFNLNTRIVVRYKHQSKYWCYTDNIWNLPEIILVGCVLRVEKKYSNERGLRRWKCCFHNRSAAGVIHAMRNVNAEYQFWYVYSFPKPDSFPTNLVSTHKLDNISTISHWCFGDQTINHWWILGSKALLKTNGQWIRE